MPAYSCGDKFLLPLAEQVYLLVDCPEDPFGHLDLRA